MIKKHIDTMLFGIAFINVPLNEDMAIRNNVTAQNNIAIVVSPDGIRQFDYTDPTSLTELSNLAL